MVRFGVIAQLPGRLLLQGRGDKRAGRSRAFSPSCLTLWYRQRAFPSMSQRSTARVSASIVQLPLLILAVIVGDKRRRACPCGSSSTSSVQYSWGWNARISSSRSTTSRVATDCTRPADRPRRIFFHSSGRKLIAHDPVQNPPRLLGVHQITGRYPGDAGWTGVDHLLRDLVKGHALQPSSSGSCSSSFKCQEMASPSRSGSVAR